MQVARSNIAIPLSRVPMSGLVVGVVVGVCCGGVKDHGFLSLNEKI